MSEFFYKLISEEGTLERLQIHLSVREKEKQKQKQNQKANKQKCFYHTVGEVFSFSVK